MKSQFYREVSNQQRTRKSTAKQRTKKDNVQSEYVNAIKISKGMKSATRGLIRSIDFNKKIQKQNDEQMMRISFSRPLIHFEQPRELPAEKEKSIISICCQCQSLKYSYQKEIKSLKMHFEEESTIQTSKFIQMQKKYLLKESELIQLSSEHGNLISAYQQLEERLKLVLNEAEDLKQKIYTNQIEISKLLDEAKRYEGEHNFFNHFLTAFVQQTKCMINWCKMFQKTYDELPSFITLVKEELFCRKVDLDLMLKESLSYKNANFSNVELKQVNTQSFFMGSEHNSSSSFMKYLKQNTGDQKIKCSRIFPFSEAKEKNCFREVFQLDKENINISNRPAFQQLIHSRINKKMEKEKAEKRNDEFLRILLAQAQAIQTSQDVKCSNMAGRSDYYANGSLLESISQINENDNI